VWDDASVAQAITSADFEPDVAAFVRAAQDSGRPGFEDMTVAQARAAYLAGRTTTQLPPVAIGAVSDDSFAGRTGQIPVRRYRPAIVTPGLQPAILFFHGGGWVIGDLDTHDSLCRQIVHATGLQLIAIDYRLAPEHVFPAAVEDACDAHTMLLDRATSWQIDPQRIAIMGDSAGGTLATVVSLHARDRCHPMPFAQVLFYPVADMANESASFAHVTGVPLTGKTLRWFRRRYVPHGQPRDDWRLSPLLADSLAGLPPTFLTIAGHDPLHDEQIAFAGRLRGDGVVVAQRHLPGQIHGYLTLGRLLSEAHRSIDAAAVFLAAQLRASPDRPRSAVLTV